MQCWKVASPRNSSSVASGKAARAPSGWLSFWTRRPGAAWPSNRITLGSELHLIKYGSAMAWPLPMGWGATYDSSLQERTARPEKVAKDEKRKQDSSMQYVSGLERLT